MIVNGDVNSNHVSISMPNLSNPVYDESDQAVYAGVSKIVSSTNMDSSSNPLRENRSKIWRLYIKLTSLSCGIFRVWIYLLFNFLSIFFGSPLFDERKKKSGIDYRINHYDYSSTANIIDGQIKINHFGCEVEAILTEWPEKYESIRFFQFCKLDHKIIYGNCRCRVKSLGELICESCQILHLYLFSKLVIDRNSSEEYVLDSLDEDKLSYVEINKNEFENGRKSLKFADQPKGSWDVEHDDYPLHNIDKKQNFLLYLVGIKENDQMEVLQSWEWGYDMEYFDGNLDHKPRKLVETNKELPKHLMSLPNANSCVFRFQVFNKSSGKPGLVVQYPKILPDGLTSRDFDEKIISKLKKSLFNQY